MAEVLSGNDALDALNQTDDGGNGVEFSSFKSGTTYLVKVLGTADLIQFYSYGIYNKVNSFVAKNPSKKSAKGYPVEDLTPWDKAWKYHKDKSEEFSDHHSQEAGKYRAKQRFAMGFIDLDTGEPIIIDVSKNQAQAIHASIKKNEKKLGKKAFELSKEGFGKYTTVSLMPEDLEDLTEKQQENFEKAPEEFDMALFDGILYEADEDEQVQRLQQAGFDVTLIGYEPKSGDETDEVEPVGSCEGGEILDEDLPF